MNYNQFMDTVYGSLPAEYCLYFYILSVIGFVLMVLAILGGLYAAMSAGRGGRRGMFSYNGLFMIIIGYFFIYFQNRLLYTMCVRSAPSGASIAAAAAANREGLEIHIPKDPNIPMSISNISPKFSRNSDGTFTATI